MKLHFWTEKEARQQLYVIVLFCALLLGGILAAEKAVQKELQLAVLEKEQAIASALLEQGVSVSAAARAFGSREITEAGISFMEKIGRSKQSDPTVWPEIRTYASAFSFAARGMGVGLGVLLICSTVFFLERRERIYQKAAMVIARFAEGDFSGHLEKNREGTLYQVFGAAEELAMALQTRGESADLAKEALKDTISDISHQLKTPLAALFMYVEIILGEPGEKALVEKFAQKSRESLERMETLILNLLKVMRLDAGSIVFEKRVCRVREVARKAAEAFEVRARQEGKQILFAGEDDAVWECDAVWTAEAVSNLVKNALEHTSRGGTIQIGWKQSPGILRVWVADDGCGIAQEELPYIFKRFYRSPGARDRQGCGLGLALAKSIVEGQGGLLSAASTPGEGCIFTLSYMTAD